MNFNDYLNMYRKYGIKLVVLFFKNAHLYDILNNTDTCTILKIQAYPQTLDNLKDAVLYQATWTSVLKFIYNYFNWGGLNDYTFYDIGCGKGKVLIYLQKKLYKFGIKFYGIEFNNDLIKVAQSNSFIMSADITFLNLDAADMSLLSNKSIIFMNNPFSQNILLKFLTNNISKIKYLIYIFPLHESLLLELGFVIEYKNDGWHPSNTFTIYKNNFLE